MTDLYIHIGTHKTGSTAIQHALRSWASVACQEGYTVLAKERTALYKKLIRAHEYSYSMVHQLNEWFPSVKKVSSTRYVLSGDGLSGNARTGFANAQYIASMLRDVTGRFNVHIILYLRRQDMFIESLYAESVKNAWSITDSFDEYINSISHKGAVNYNTIISAYVENFGSENISVRSYDAVSNNAIVNDFSKIIGSKKLPAFSENNLVNVSYSQVAVDIKRHINSHLGELERRYIDKVFGRKLNKIKGEHYFYFSDAERRKLLERCEESNKLIADKYFDGDMNKLFSTTTYERARGAQLSLDSETIAEVIEDIMAGVDIREDSR